MKNLNHNVNYTKLSQNASQYIIIYSFIVKQHYFTYLLMKKVQ